jgi:hypothetical protein
MTGKSPTGDHYEIGGGRSIIGGGLYFCGYFLVLEWGYGFLVNHCKGHRAAGGFGHEG